MGCYLLQHRIIALPYRNSWRYLVVLILHYQILSDFVPLELGSLEVNILHVDLSWLLEFCTDGVEEPFSLLDHAVRILLKYRDFVVHFRLFI